jgi:hypothetical protein
LAGAASPQAEKALEHARWKLRTRLRPEAAK